MGRVRVEKLTRAKVIQLGLVFLFLGGFGYAFFRLVGFEGTSAGIASEAALVLVLVGWVVSYLIRVVTGKMTFNEQRKRYLEAYEKLTTAELQSKFESMTQEEQARLLKEVEKE